MATPAIALTTETFVGAPNGMGRYVPQHELADTEAYSLFDITLNNAGFVRRRGPLTETASGTGNTSARVIGLSRTQAPDGTEQIIKLNRTTAPAGALRGVVNATMNFAWPYTPGVSPYELFDSKDALLGGALIGTATDTSLNPVNAAIGFWHGAAKDNVGSTSLSSSFAIGATTITLASGGTNFCAGHFIFNLSGNLVGTVKSVSGNVLTLRDPALVAGATSVTAKAVRGVVPRVSTGRITCGTTSTQINGGETKFSAQGLASGTWDLYTPNYTWIGTVSSVVSDIQLNLSANPTVALLNSDYIAIKTSADHTLLTAGPGTVGWLNCAFAGHQFYARQNILCFSDTTDREAVDLTNDGNTIIFSADPIRAICSGETAILTITENEAYALTGAVGTTPDRWRGERVHDDGTICGMSALSYKGGVIWAGKRGIWYWNGTSPVNLAAKLGDDYRTYVKSATRAWGMIVNNHYFCFIENGASGVFSKTKGASTTNSGRWTIVINLQNGVISMMSNVEFRGAVDVPSSVSSGTASGTIFAASTNEPASRVFDGMTLFADAGGAGGSVTLDNTTTGGSSLSFSHTVGSSARYLVVQVNIANNTTTGTGVTYNGVAMSLLQRQVNANGIELWGLANPTVGANTVAITLSGAVGTASTAYSFQSTGSVIVPVVTSGSGSGNGGVSITGQSGDLLVSAIVGAGAATASFSGASSIWNDGSGDAAASVAATGSAQNLTWTTGGTWAIINFALRPGMSNDAFACDGGPGVGPDFYLETKKYDGRDPQRLKLWKMFLLHFFVIGDSLNLDTVPGLNTVGTTATSSFPVVSSFTDKRIKFMKRSQFLSLRLWQNSSSVTRVTLGPWALALKYKRPGRV